MTLYALFDEYLESISANSQKTYGYYIRDFKSMMKNAELKAVTVHDIQKYINYKKSMNLKATTVFRYYRMLKTIFNYAVSHKYIKENPCCGVHVKHALRAQVRDIDYSKKYIKKLLRLYKKTVIYHIVLIAVHTRHEKN